MSRGAHDVTEFHVHNVEPRPFIAIGIPTFGMVHAFFMARLLNLRIPMNRAIRYIYVIGREVGHARNEIVTRALESDGSDQRCSHVFFLDDDVLFHPDSLRQLLSRQRPIVSGLYYAKSLVPTPLVFHGEYEGLASNWTPGDLVECYGHGMGLTLIEADVFRRVRDASDLGVDQYGHSNWFTTTRDTALVRPDGVTGIYNQTEDIAFLNRAKALGYQPAVDTSEMAFGWHFDTKACTGYPREQWKQFVTEGTVTWPSPSGAITWGASAA